MANYSFLAEHCAGCGKSLARDKAAIASMKGETADGQGLPQGKCPKCGVSNPLVPEPTEPTEPTGETEPAEPEPEPEPAEPSEPES